LIVLHEDLGDAAGCASVSALVLMDKTLSPLAFRLYVLACARAYLRLDISSWAEALGESEHRITTATDELLSRGLFTKDGSVMPPGAVYSWNDVYEIHPDLATVHAELRQPGGGR
jgi:hypothetical protein